MPIYINARFLTHCVSGVERVAIELSRKLKRMRDDIVWIAPRKGIVLKEIAEELDVLQIGNLKGHLWEQIDLPLYLKKQGNPLLVNLMNTAPLFYKNKMTVIYDAAFYRYPKTFSFAFRLFYQLMIPMFMKTSIVVVTISQFSKSELISFAKNRKIRIDVISCAVDPSFFYPQDNKQDCSTERYFLAVGSLHPQKNLITLLKAMQILGSDYQLYVVGGQRVNFAANSEMQNYVSDNVKFLGRVSDQELLTYYQNAEALIFPSLYEGFGIPPLEAQSCGTPAIVSDIPVLREIYGNSVLYFDPLNPNDIAEKMKLLYHDSELGSQLIKRGFENAGSYSWEKSAQRLSDFIDKLI